MVDLLASDGRGLTRITFNAVPKAVEDLHHLATMTGLSRTDLLNRAIQVYRFVDEWIREPGGLRIVRSDGSVEKVYIL